MDDITRFSAKERSGTEENFVQHWMQRSIEGNVLYVVFFTKKCQWALCYSCSLHITGSEGNIDLKNIINQVDYVQHLLLTFKKPIHKIIISNNGSVFDERTFPKKALDYLISIVTESTQPIKVLSIETRVEYVKEFDLAKYSEKLMAIDILLELAIGVEVFDIKIRNRIYKKGLSNKSIEQISSLLSKYKCKLKLYFMIKPIATMTNKQAVEDIQNAIKWLSYLTKAYEIPVNLHLNLTYVGIGSMLEMDKSAYRPVSFKEVVTALIPAHHTDISLYIGYYNEGLSLGDEYSETMLTDEVIRDLDKFNSTQDYQYLLKHLVL